MGRAFSRLRGAGGAVHFSAGRCLLDRGVLFSELVHLSSVALAGLACLVVFFYLFFCLFLSAEFIYLGTLVSILDGLRMSYVRRR